MRDFKPMTVRPERRARWLPWFIAGMGLPLVTVAFILPRGEQPAPKAAAIGEPGPESGPVVSEDAGPAEAATGEAEPQAPVGAAATTLEIQIPWAPTPAGTAAMAASKTSSGVTKTLTVGRGDSLDRLFRRNDLSISDLSGIMKPDLSRKHLKIVRPGDEILVVHDGGNVLELRRELDFSRSLLVSRTDDGFEADIALHEIVSREVQAKGEISSSLFEAAADAGISDRVIMNLAGIFAWDIDFVLDIRGGDEFTVIYEEMWRDGERVAVGEILAAEFVNQGEQFRAVRYKDPDGRTHYFTPDGKNMRKAFVRAPLSFTRVSSNFNPRRRHPRLNTIRAHRGVDYAAPTGTPVKAAGDGKVIFRGTKGGYGSTVILQHGSNITTLYAHLSRFARGASNGKRVRQGDVIGYVGQSGLATGPHLHYEYRKNGVHLNPRTVKLPAADPIAPGLREDFLRTAQPLLDSLNDQRSLTADASEARTI